MYPILFHVPFLDWPVTSFGVMMVVGFLAAWWLTAKRLQELGYDPEIASNLLLWCVIGGIVGSKLYFAVDTTLRGTSPGFFEAFFSRGGMTWYGGLLGGIAAGALGARLNGLAVGVFANAVAPGIALGQAFGRVGCFLVGDDYGRPTDLPWGIAFPQGMPPTDVPVHPTQLYEVAWLLPVAFVLWRRRDRSPSLFGEYLVANGIGRIVVEHWRVNPPLALGLTQPQWIGLVLAATGMALWLRARSDDAHGSSAGAR